MASLSLSGPEEVAGSSFQGLPGVLRRNFPSSSTAAYGRTSAAFSTGLSDAGWGAFSTLRYQTKPKTPKTAKAANTTPRAMTGRKTCRAAAGGRRASGEETTVPAAAGAGATAAGTATGPAATAATGGAPGGRAAGARPAPPAPAAPAPGGAPAGPPPAARRR